MRLDLKAQYLRYTRDELLQIAHHPDNYTPEEVSTAFEVLDEKYAGWNNPEKPVQNGENVPLSDLLQDLEEEEGIYDPWAVRVFWGALLLMFVGMAFYLLAAVRFIFFHQDGNTVAFRLGFSISSYALPLAGIGVLAYFWYRRSRLAWMCFYLYILFGIVSAVNHLWILAHLGNTVIRSRMGILGLGWNMTLIIIYAVMAWMVARDNFIGYFGVSIKTRRYTMIVGLLQVVFGLANTVLSHMPSF
ncbi:hypothetical protein GA0116948_11317 [Chitinophaga costaii]|uniref:Uncharacterized protein n=1 Tax=Chitinophaga costaii TaxID=1335309 RepID=A0A1C4FAF8_9BACT|nr:hypothetical protein [Chitinophaga costaii]PUZ20728.1 hypothetical protein DCM91_18380 [Chitinophaga costaii]SCC52999.1 hypothetical protein GA0116948_11317 [Chitinophaga costaii]